MIGDNSVRRLAAMSVGLSRRAVSRLLPGALVFFAILTLGLGEAVLGQNPTCSIAVGTALIYDGALVQEVTVTYNEAMRATPTPMIQFLTTIGTWAPGSGTWDLVQHVWTQSFTISDADEETSGIDVYASGAQNVVGDAQIPNTLADGFNVNTWNPSAPVIRGVADDNGFSDADGITNDNTLILSGTAESQTSMQLYRDGSLIGTTSASGGAWTFDYQVTALADGAHHFEATATDLAGNVSPESIPLTILVDTRPAPAPQRLTPPDGTRTNDNTPTFSWATTPSDPGGSGVRDYGYDIGGPTPKNSTTTNTTYTPASGSPLSDGEYVWKLRTRDVAGNPGPYGSGWSLVIDTASPSVSTVVADRSPVYDGDLVHQITVTFSEAMRTGAAPGITFSAGTWTGGAAGAWSVGNTMWTRTYTLTDSNQTAANVTVDVAGAQDAAGNAQQDYTPQAEFNIDTQNPIAAVTTDHTMVALGSPVYGGSRVLTVTVTYDEVMNTLTAPVITLENEGANWGSQTSLGWTGNDMVYRATFTHNGAEEPTPPVPALVAFTRVSSTSGARDLAGNADVGGDSPTFEIDTRKPRSTVTTDHTLIADSSPICEGSLMLTVTVTYDEAMNTSTAPTVTLQSGGSHWSSPTLLGWTGNTVYRATFTHDATEEPSLPATAITAFARVASGSGARDLAGNADVGDDSPTFEIDTRKPRSTVTTDHTLTADGSPIYEGSLMLTVTVTYDEAMSMSTTPAITLQNAGRHWGAQTSLGWTGNTVYRATFTHNGTEEPTPPVPALVAFARVSSTSGATDVAGNADVGGDSPTFEIDTRKPEPIPGVAAVAIDTDPVYEGDLTQRVTVTFDEAMDTGTTPAIVFGHGTWTTNHDGVWSSGYTIWTVTYTLADHDEEYYSLTGSVVTVDVVGARDAAGNLQEPYAAEPEFDIDTLQPQITEFTSVPDGGCHVAGDTIDITVAFSESVFGALTLNLDSGGIVDVFGVVSSDSETRTYTIQWGENSCDLDVESAVVDAGGDLVDWAGNYAHWTGGATNLSLPTGHNLADNSAVIADTTIPIAVTDPDEDETRSGADSDIVEVRLDPQGQYRLTVRQDTPVYIDVLANDIELPCLSHLSVYDFPVLPTYGTIPDENPANPVRYAPYAGYIGPDEFTYRAVDACGNISVEATVYVEVIPQLVLADVYVTACAAASVEIDVVATDLFVPPGAPEGVEFAFEIVEGPEHGIVAGDPTEVETTEPGTSTLFIESATVKFIYAPASGFVGRDQFRVRFSDPFGGASTAVIDIEVQKCPWVEEAPLVIPQGALLPLIVPLSFASVYETAWDTVTLTGEDGTEHPQALLATWNESLERPTLVVDTGPLALGAYELVIPLGNGEIVALRFAVGEKS